MQVSAGPASRLSVADTTTADCNHSVCTRCDRASPSVPAPAPAPAAAITRAGQKDRSKARAASMAIHPAPRTNAAAAIRAACCRGGEDPTLAALSI
jgi:hypothetical protein